MRAGLFLEGLARSHTVRLLVAPVVAGAPPEPGFVRLHAGSVEVLEPEAPADPAAALQARLLTPAGRERATAVHPLPALSARLAPDASARVAAAADGAAVVHVLRAYLAPLLDDLLDAAERPRLVLDVDDLESDTRRRLGEAEEAGRYERLEAHYLPLLDHVIATAHADADELRRRHGLNAVTAVPNAVRPPAAHPLPKARHDLVFVGNLAYGPNIAAARWLCEEVLPLLDGVTVALVGSSPDPAVLALAGDSVHVAADVPEVGSWYSGARVAVAPLRVGGGSRTKVLEALAYGLPVVATPAGAEGLDLEGVVVADTPQEFAAACRGLLDDPALAAELGTRGEAAVRTGATVERVAGRIDALYRAL